MSNSWYFTLLIVYVLYKQVSILSGEMLFQKGYYKTYKKGLKMRITNVPYIDGDIIPDTKYIKINARIPTFHQGGVRNLRNVTTLKFMFCAIKELNPGAFVNLTSLSTLALQDNEIEKVKYGVFNNMTVSVLFLQRNEINSISSDAFNDMPNLYKLKLNNNKISKWDTNWFLNTPHITELFFRRNSLENIPERAFKHIKGSHLSGDSIIIDTKIYLSKNKISSIDPEAFQGLEELSQLWLDRNQLREIDESVFSNVTQIGAVFLSKNRLTSLPKKLFSDVKIEILKLDLSDNHNFSCLPYEIAVKVKETNLKGIKNFNVKCMSKTLERLDVEKKHNKIKLSN